MKQRGNLKLYEEGDKLPEEVSWYEDPAPTPVFVKKTENGILSIPFNQMDVEERNQVEFYYDETGERKGVVQHYSGRTEMGVHTGTMMGVSSYTRMTLTKKELGLVASIVRNRGQEVPQDIQKALE